MLLGAFIAGVVYDALLEDWFDQRRNYYSNHAGFARWCNHLDRDRSPGTSERQKTGNESLKLEMVSKRCFFMNLRNTLVNSDLNELGAGSKRRI